MGRGGERACYVNLDLSYNLEGENRKAKKLNGMKKKKKCTGVSAIVPFEFYELPRTSVVLDAGG